MRRAVVLIPLGALLVTAGLAAGEWRTYAGGPQRLFFNPAETQITPLNVGRLRVKWTFGTDAIVTASPTVARLDVPGAGRIAVVFVQSWDGNLYALRAESGTELWRFETAFQPGATFPNVGSVDVHTLDGTDRACFAAGETVYCVDALTGTELWHFEAGTGCGDPPGLCAPDGERNEVESSPLMVDGKLFFGMDVNDEEGGKGGFYAVDARDGRLVWFFDLETGATCRPLPGDNIRRFDGHHGEAELTLPPGFFATRPGCDFDRTGTGCGNVWSSPAVDRDRGLLYFVSSNCDTDTNPATLRPPPPMPPYDEAIVALRLDGAPAWRWRPREVDNLDFAFGATPNLFTIDVGGLVRDVVGVGGKDGTYYVIDRDGMNEVSGVAWNDPDPTTLPYWRTNVVPGGNAGGIIATAAVDEAAGRIYFSTAVGNGEDALTPQQPTVHALDKHTGAVLWQNTTEAPGGLAQASFAPTSAVPGVVFVGSVPPPGALRAYDAASGARLASVTVGPIAVASGATVIDGLVIVGSGIGARNFERIEDPEHQTSRIPENVTALCVRGTPDCDADADGVDPPDDCDDADPAVFPAAPDLPDNAVDENCDGLLARSRDRCRQGGSAPQDTLNLGALGAAVETTCPCASFQGGRGGTAGAYFGCARQAISQAVAAGTVRRRCRRTAKSEARASTCGRAGKVVCCETRGGRGRCVIGAAGRCASRAKATRVRCFATHCAETDCAAAGVCSAPDGTRGNPRGNPGLGVSRFASGAP